MKLPTTSLLAAATAVALLAGATAHAQMPQMQHRSEGARHEQMGHSMGHAPSQKMAQHMAERQAQLKAALKLTPAQEGAWTRYTDAHQPPKRGQKVDREAWSQLTTPQRLDQMQARKAERDAHMAQMADATRALYAVLTAEQQKVFDSQAPMANMGGKHRGEHGMRGHSHGG